MEIIAVYSENHKKPTNTLCGQNGELLTVKACTERYQKVYREGTGGISFAIWE
jgi:hypothetical protein